MDVMSVINMIGGVPAIISFVLGLIAPLALYIGAKQKVAQLRAFVEDLDEALKDDHVSDEEYRELWDDGLVLIKF